MRPNGVVQEGDAGRTALFTEQGQPLLPTTEVTHLLLPRTQVQPISSLALGRSLALTTRTRRPFLLSSVTCLQNLSAMRVRDSE